jgi:hypothetical protein
VNPAHVGHATATQSCGALDAGEMSVVERATSAIARIEQFDGAIIELSVRDFDRALAAPAPEPRRAQGTHRRLVGVPLAVGAVDVAEFDCAHQLVRDSIDIVPGLPATVVAVGRAKDGLPIRVWLIVALFENRTPIRPAELQTCGIGGFEVPPLQGATK